MHYRVARTLAIVTISLAASGSSRTATAAEISPRAILSASAIQDVRLSPDGRRLVVSALRVTDGRILNPFQATGLDNDLYVVDAATGAHSILVAQPGWDIRPAWSPDGRWIAFVSQRGVKDWNYGSCVAVVPAAGGPVTYPDADAERERGSAPGELTWDARSEGVYFDAFRRGGRHLFHASREGRVRQITPDGGDYHEHFSVLPKHDLVAMTAERPATPADVVTSPLGRFDARPLTAVNPEWPREGLPAMETLSWRSADGTQIHGHLLLPPGRRPGDLPLPTLVYLPGGPSMARTGFQFDESLYPFLTFASRGFAVFVPNSRGRGGWGRALRQAMPEHADFLPGPYADVMAGVDSLVERGIADPQRLGLAGFSYGAASAARDAGAPFFGILQHFQVPSVLVVYPRTGHGIDEPLLLLDSFERNLAWFERWLRTEPTGDPAIGANEVERRER